MKRTWTVDSIEEGIAAVQEDGGTMLHVPAWLLPGETREGDILSLERREARGAVSLRIKVDRAATEASLLASREQLARLKQNDPGGDITL